VTKILAYCAFLHHPGTSLPDSGVNGAPLQEITQGGLGLLWSEVEFPFDPAVLQRNALEFHRVVSHMFSQGAVVPFRLLSVFDDWQSLADFMAAHQAGFVADLERLQNLVQMECVLYFAPQPGVRPSGKDYLERKAELLKRAEEFVQNIRNALGTIGKEIRIRESRNGGRIFVLVERGNEKKFHSFVQDLPIPERLARRISGPWPPAEFLSDSVKMPPIAGQKIAGPK
jgi:Gas vesicle synthesis protein GvpL/GvpF